MTWALRLMSSSAFDMALFKWETLSMEKCFLLVFTRADDVIF